ncbi:MAG: VOC family protein [Alphaproteobacteria bacterium]|nr:MAG: VOC family protein [Alphaproteobacteria bacterium]
MIQSLTPVVPVERIEPSAAFFAKVGFAVTVSVPEDDHMGFAILSSGTAEVMYQTRSLIEEDSEAFKAAAQTTPVLLFVQVDDIEAVEAALQGEEIVMPRRETFYGSKETGYREPGGHIVTFAQFPPQEG